jgi:polysaccharide deacetylase 2 family uncharacterized protein YibQ
MAKKKIRGPKKPRKKKRKSSIPKTYLIKAFSGLGVLIILVVIAGVLTHRLISRKYPIAPVTKPQVTKTPRFEIYPKEEIPPRKPVPRPIIPIPKKLPKIAIIIDDIGYDKHMAEKFLGLDTVLTFSILPYSPYQKSIARAARSKGFDVMLHLPMEPHEYPLINPGPGALLTSMSPDQLIRQLEENLDSVPFIKGVNNHMGSKMTTVSSQLHQIFSVLKKRNLFFVDSRTTADTLCKPSAHLFQIPFAEKDVFVDHIQRPDFIRRQLYLLIQIAHSHGMAVGIAHPHAATYEVLRDVLPELKKKAILVPASEIVHIAG